MLENLDYLSNQMIRNLTAKQQQEVTDVMIVKSNEEQLGFYKIHECFLLLATKIVGDLLLFVTFLLQVN